ncbi:MAG TPA: hypothetical protein PK542_08965 [Treponemataceae bacterium]|nr:hypothetical protein [Treponemataceae bacterium]HPS44606.1 hypothetical protein [Treponemataceae bacterium]
MNSLVAVFLIIFICNCAAMVIFYRILRSRFSPQRVLRDLRSEVDKLIVDLGREADRDVAILESRIKNLRALIDEADRRILVANREAVKKDREQSVIAETLGGQAAMPMDSIARGDGGGTSARAQSLREPSLDAEPSAATRGQAVPANPVDNRQLAEKPPAEKPRARPSPSAPPPPRNEAEGRPVTIYTRPTIKRSETPIEPYIPVRERALDMARKGFTAPMIASTLSLPLGEVELILDMNSSSL